MNFQAFELGKSSLSNRQLSPPSRNRSYPVRRPSYNMQLWRPADEAGVARPSIRLKSVRPTMRNHLPRYKLQSTDDWASQPALNRIEKRRGANAEEDTPGWAALSNMDLLAAPDRPATPIVDTGALGLVAGVPAYSLQISVRRWPGLRSMAAPVHNRLADHTICRIVLIVGHRFLWM